MFFIRKTIDVFLPKRTCVDLEFKETKNLTHFLVLKAHLH